MAAASGDGAVDQRDLVGHLLWRRAMRNEQPIGTTKCLLKRMRLIEIDSGDAGTLGQLSRVGPPGQHGDIDRIGSEQAGQRRADATRRTRYGDARLARCRLDFPGHVEVTLVSWNDQSKMSSGVFMSGKPQFDEAAVVAAAIEVFWRHGYSAAAISDLTEATGLSRSSLYQRFQDKDGLSQETLEAYKQRAVRRMNSTKADNGRGRLNALLRAFLPDRPRSLGCLI